jgi:RND superfamily putative drug exporter
MFAGWGRFVHRHRGPVLVASAVFLAVALGIVSQGASLVAYQTPTNTESGRADRLVESQVPGASDATVAVILSSGTSRWDDPAFQAAVNATLAPWRADARVASLLTPYDAPPTVAPSLVSRDGHRVLAVATLKADLTTARDLYPSLRAKLHSTTLDVKATDRVAIYADINRILDEDLKTAEAVSLPLSLVLLLLVFGTAVAALLPVGVGLLAVLGGMAAVYLLARGIDVSVYAVNIVSLIGLGVAIDYSLFMVSRFREELARGAGVEDALATTVATAGRATTFSGLTVAIGLLGLTFFRGLYFQTMGVAGAFVVALAVLFALTFLPALLSILGERVNKLPVRLPLRRRGPGRFWERLAHGVMRRPVLVLVPTLVLILAAGAPFLDIRLAGGGVTALPDNAESRLGADLLRHQFPGQGTNTITVVLQFTGRDPLSREAVGAAYDFSHAVAKLPGVVSVQSPVDLSPTTSRADAQGLYAQPRSALPPEAQAIVARSVGRDVMVLEVKSSKAATSDAARDLVHAIRALLPPAGGRALVTGPTAQDLDMIDLILQEAPAAVAFIVVTTYVLLLLQTGSVVLPLKAVLMNFLSIAASFGALVWVFQKGNFSLPLDFTPAPIDPALPVLMFCIVFGLSMDYEVLLLSRMHEEYERTGDNTEAVAQGLAKTGRLITSAAMIMVLVFAAFALAHVTLIKAIGLGLAIAVAVDATVVRMLIVPATMRLMGRWNWWAPRWIHRLWKALG